MPIWLEVLIAVIAAAGGGSGIAAFVSALRSRRAVRGAARQADINALTMTIKALAAENKRLSVRVEELDCDLIVAKLAVAQLTDKVRLVEDENGRLRHRIEELERENCELKGKGNLR